MAVVHTEVRKVLEHNCIVAACKFAYDAQLLLGKADPRRVVRVGIDNRRNISRSKLFLKAGAKALSPAIGIDIEGTPANAKHRKLGLLNRKARVYKQDFVLARNALGAGSKGPEGSLHGTGSRNAAGRSYIYIYKGLNETRGSLLEFGHASCRRILASHSPVEGALLGLDAVAVRCEGRRALVHTDKRDAGAFLQPLRNQQGFTYCCS